MVILISGNSCTGKTLMAQKLLEMYKIPYLSIDHLKMGLYRGAIDCSFSPLDRDEVIGEKLWPVIREIIKVNIENNQNIIIEGCYILPQFIKNFEKAYLDKIIAIFIGFSENYIKKNFTSNIIKHRNAIEFRNYPEERTISKLINEHDAFRKACKENDVDFFEIDKNYEEEIMRVYNFIDSKVINQKLGK